MNNQKLTGYPSIDKPWLKYYSEAAINAPLPERTVWENICERNKNHLTDTALLYFGKKTSYGKLFSEIDKTAKALAYLGVKNGDNVAICMPAVPEAIYTILALNKLGANAGMLNPTFNEVQLTDRVNEMEAEVLIVVNELYATMQNVIPGGQFTGSICAHGKKSEAHIWNAEVECVYPAGARHILPNGIV